jgi:hypothetical protein
MIIGKPYYQLTNDKPRCSQAVLTFINFLGGATAVNFIIQAKHEIEKRTPIPISKPVFLEVNNPKLM